MLGLPDPEMLLRLPQRVHMEWLRYYQEGPLLYRLLDIHLSRLTAAVINAHNMDMWSSRRTRGKPATVKAEDFQFWEPLTPKKPEGEQLLDRVIILNRLFGGEFIDRRSDNG